MTSLLKENFFIYIFTGEGKGKTTAALGLGVEEALKGKKVYIVQFLKGGGYTGELFAANYLKDNLIIRQFGHGCPKKEEIKSGAGSCDKCGICFRENRKAANGYAVAAFDFAKKIAVSEKPDMLILDEISHAIKHNLISKKQAVDFIELLKATRAQMKLALTGRNMPLEIMALAQEITYCRQVKHPITEGIGARRGIEY